MTSIAQIRDRLRNPVPETKMEDPAPVKQLKEVLDISDSEDDEPVPWDLDALAGDYSDENIIKTLTDEDNYTYNTKKSQKAFRKLFVLKCQVAQDNYLEAS
jgi:hypothetical protein